MTVEKLPMRHDLRRALTGAVASLLWLFPARAAGAPRSEAAPAAPTAPSRRLRLLPERVSLDGPLARQQLIVLGERADGSVTDLTAQSRLASAQPAIVRVQGAAVRAGTQNGGARILVRAAGLTAYTTVQVTHVEAPVFYSFQNDVVPTLARLGCSSGTCHGANSGKGGFRLSLRGYAPELDFLWITRQFAGRRISREAPEQSLFLRKPLMLTSHGGGKRLTRDTPEYDVLLGWIQEGAPGPDPSEPRVTRLQLLPAERACRTGEAQQFVALATYSDGRTRDVTDRALFQSNDPGQASVTEGGRVRALNPGQTAVMAKLSDQLAVARIEVPFPQTPNPAAFPSPVNFVDRAVQSALRRLRLEPGPPCRDDEFLRRLFLDGLGTLPTAAEARRFLVECDAERTRPAHRSPRKKPDPTNWSAVPVQTRARWIEHVLDRPERASVWALKLSDLFLMRKEHMGRKNTLALHQWLTEQFLANRPWDQVVTALVTAAGAIAEKPETLWWASRQSTRPNANGWVRHYELTGEIAAQVFVGQRIQCARCHNHPTERYTQDDYYSFAALFAQVNGEGRANPVPEVFSAKDRGEVRQPRTGQVMPARPLDRSALTGADGDDRRIGFARWLTGEGKHLFARNIANRIWARSFGSGVVEPVDDLRSTNPPRVPDLLEALGDDLIAHGYDLKATMRAIWLSRTYQTSAIATPANRVDTQYFSRYPVRRLQAEELLDAVVQVTGIPDRFANYPVGTRAQDLSDTEIASPFLDTFGRPVRVMPCDCERGSAPSLSQALDLFNGENLQSKLKDPTGVIAQLARSGRDEASLIEELFLTTVARHPRPAELVAMRSALLHAPDREQGFQDALWALINTREFQFQH